MNEYVGVDPVRIRKLADRLKDLESALSKHGALIRKNFKEWDGSLDLSLIAKQLHAVGDDGRDMAKRADLARNLEEHGGMGVCTPDGNILDIPWDMSGVRKESAKEAKQEAETLKKALDDPKAGGSREDIKAIAQSLADHQDDPAYLTAFAAAGGIADAARVGTAFHQEDGTHGGKVLNDDSTKVIGQYATGINRIFALQKSGKIPPNPDYAKALSDPPGGDMWSVGMLFKYGPKGDQWDPTVLSQVGGAMLDWRDKQKAMRPSYASASPPYSAGGYVGKDDGGWYHSLGLDPDYLSKGADDNDRIVDGIRDNDPALAVISRIGENPDASRDLLGHDNDASKRYAKDLVDFKWQTPGAPPRDDSDGPRRVLTLAATDRSPEHIDQSGAAAANIFAAASAQKDAFDGRNDFEKDEYASYPNGTAVALAGITGTWAKDIGATGMAADPGTFGYSSKSHTLVTNNDDMVKAMQLFTQHNSGAAAMFDATLHQQVSEAAGSKDAENQLVAMGNTAGMFTKAKVGIEYSKAEQVDEDHKFNLAMLNTAGMVFGMASAPAEEGAAGAAAKVVEKGLKYSQNLVLLGRTEVAPEMDAFSVDNADKQEAISSDAAKVQYHSFIPSVAQGLIRSGKVPVPEGESWYDPKAGTIAPGATKNEDFLAWWTNAEHHGLISNFQDGFDNAEVSLDGK
ncbi:hypothetical protein [Streptomyces sp. NBC_00859]|uniref:hypothetical protein n=1 Tax=Streptomyces sp. NBC_00859 TaxID=2903682 RepID=UPI0038634469|nr:hypothetical protein OG584_13900 [Streptomyces sp. NBC_00859]